MNSIFKHILSILYQRERRRLFWLTLFDLIVGLLDLVFLAFLLLIINFHTKNGSPVRLSFLPQFLLIEDSLLLISIFLVFFAAHDTVLENIILSEKAHDAICLDQVLMVCGLDSFFKQQPDDLGTPIRENSKNISGSQRQRIMLARALYHEFDLLIPDEAFSELGEASEHAILMRLKSFIGVEKMLLLITHLKKSLDFCTHLIHLDGA